GGVRADARRRIAGTGHVALIRSRADDRTAAGADTRLAGVGARASVGVAARCPVGSVRVRAASRRRIARTRDVALIRGRADDWIAAGTEARLACVGPCAGVGVAARRSVRSGRVRAASHHRIARTRDVALIRGRADDGVAAYARTVL